MDLVKSLIEKSKDQLLKKYVNLLLTQRIRVSNIPEWLRQDLLRSPVIYLTAFRVDRGTSKEQFYEDLNFLNLEINLTQNPQLREALESARINVLEYL